MSDLDHLLERNRQWAARVSGQDSEYFSRLVNQQTPSYLWIGCSDSRVPANELIDLAPGEVFVHRNVANQVIHTDFNCLSVIQYAVAALRVKHVIITGHYGCGGVQAAMQNVRLGLIDNWLRNIQDIERKYSSLLEPLDPEQRYRAMCELNVLEQVNHIAQTSILQEAWEAGQEISVHGWIYQVGDGLLRDLGLSLTAPDASPVQSLNGWDMLQAQRLVSHYSGVNTPA